jgi:twinkle protein
MNLTATDIIENCQHNGLIVQGTKDYRQSPTHIILRECPFCTKPTNDAADNLFKLYIALNSGAYHCHRCGQGGSWYDWKLKLSPGNHLGQNVDPSGYNYNADVVKLQHPPAKAASSSSSNYQSYQGDGEEETAAGGGKRSVRVQHQSQRIAPLPMPPQHLQKLTVGNLMARTKSATMDYLVNVRGLTTTTLMKYGVGMAEYKFADNDGVWQATDCVTFPWILKVSDMAEQERLRGATMDAEWKDKGPDTLALRRLKARSIERKSWQRMDPAGGGWGLFGYHTIPDDATELVLTEGEYDAMAVWQGTKRAAISLPNGCRSLPVEVLPMLERFDKIYLWMDNDAAGKEGAEMFARKIGLARCLIVKPTLANCGGMVTTMEELPKDANDALRKGLNLETIVADAKRVPHERIIHFTDLRKSVLDEIMYPDKYVILLFGMEGF